MQMFSFKTQGITAGFAEHKNNDSHKLLQSVERKPSEHNRRAEPGLSSSVITTTQRVQEPFMEELCFSPQQ